MDTRRKTKKKPSENNLRKTIQNERKETENIWGSLEKIEKNKEEWFSPVLGLHA